ncbi:MAG: hypothetical protein LCH52_08300 [Bacteroidetes bacterium]|nr:hypothetical protein [Bacteroidota bacterium]
MKFNFGTWLIDQVEFVKTFFVGYNKPSMKRLLSFIVVLVFVYHYSVVAAKSLEIVDIPLNWATLIAGIIGLGILDKVAGNKKSDT